MFHHNSHISAKLWKTIHRPTLSMLSSHCFLEYKTRQRFISPGTFCLSCYLQAPAPLQNPAGMGRWAMLCVRHQLDRKRKRQDVTCRKLTVYFSRTFFYRLFHPESFHISPSNTVRISVDFIVKSTLFWTEGQLYNMQLFLVPPRNKAPGHNFLNCLWSFVKYVMFLHIKYTHFSKERFF